MPTNTRNSYSIKSASTSQVNRDCENVRFTDDASSDIFNAIQKEFEENLEIIQSSFEKQIQEVKGCFENTLKRYLTKIDVLEKRTSALEKENEILKAKIEDVEQSQLNNTLIISGSDIIDACNAMPEDMPPYKKEVKAVETVLFKKLKLNASDFSILSAKRLGYLPSNKSEDKRAVVITVDDSSKNAIYSAIVSNKSKTLFINEFLTPRRRDMLKSLLEARKVHRDKYMQVFTKNGIIHVRLHKEERPKQIKNAQDMESVLDEMTKR